jgi:hypothetical protein
MKTLKIFNNIAEIIENNKVECRLSRQDANSEQLIQQLIVSGQYNVVSVNQSPDMSAVPADFDWTQSLEQ